MNKFQKYCRDHPEIFPDRAFDKFKEFFPDIPPKAAKYQFQQQISELFCCGLKKQVKNPKHNKFNKSNRERFKVVK